MVAHANRGIAAVSGVARNVDGTKGQSGSAVRWLFSADFDVLPEADPASGRDLEGPRRLVDPGIAPVPHAVDHPVVELNAVRASQFLRGLGTLLEPLLPDPPRWKV